MNDEQFAVIVDKLDLVAKGLFLNMVKDLEFKEQVIILGKIGIKEAEIVKLLGENREKVHSILRQKKKK